MRRTDKRQWSGFLPGLALGALLVGLSACDLSGTSHTPAAPGAMATLTAGADATAQAGGVAGASAPPMAHLGMPSVDPGWVAVVEIPDGAKLGGPEVMGGTPGSGIASSNITLGYFELSSAAQVAIIFGCSSPASAHATLQVGVDGAADQVQCGPSGATMNRSQVGFAPTDVGRTLAVTATISTQSQPPQWYALVEQPK
jgi:hypothetical protein